MCLDIFITKKASIKLNKLGLKEEKKENPLKISNKIIRFWRGTALFSLFSLSECGNSYLNHFNHGLENVIPRIWTHC